MKNIIQNIFIDQKSYELIQNKSNSEKIISTILDNMDTTKVQAQSLIICGIEYKAEFHPKNDYFGFTFTKDGHHYVDHVKSRFKNSVYLYSSRAMDEYDKDFSGATLLLYTKKKFIYAIPDGKNRLCKMDCSTGELDTLENKISTKKMLDSVIVNAFMDKCSQIYKFNEEYWLIVKDVYSQETDSCYEIYFSILDEGWEYFELRIIGEDELKEFLYMKPDKIYPKEAL